MTDPHDEKPALLQPARERRDLFIGGRELAVLDLGQRGGRDAAALAQLLQGQIGVAPQQAQFGGQHIGGGIGAGVVVGQGGVGHGRLLWCSPV